MTPSQKASDPLEAPKLETCSPDPSTCLVGDKGTETPSSTTTSGEMDSSQNSSLLKQKPRKIGYVLDWAVKVVSLIAAILFGIWAPLSYRATVDESHSNDAAQQKVVNAMESANAQASSALDLQISALGLQQSAAKAQSAILDDIGNRIAAMGQLSLVEFCLSQKVRWIFLCRSSVPA
ncbi:hypothetical protein W97_00030 [Coniosporium apollinis CBS 100218]|uniref:Uncharacterized protein n=1 Tax=Coniosporium apollinis (strain CBS 100218) TaxID=1168221 RepID=R7YGN6_CONA1|nr:uncharacterized protein W97_00030 [Coniosporium apollinis CBS 100218]EON60821.1 hypothetical protein W97_00030 [Coniosporium apollinis CBS 100218]